MKKAIIIIFFAAILILQTLQTQPAETQPVNLGASGDTREAYDCSRCIAGTEKCTAPSSDYTVIVNGATEEKHDNAQCTLDWDSATFDFSTVSMAALNNNIEKVSDEALRNNMHLISDLAGLTSQAAKDRLSKTFKEKYGIGFGVIDTTGKVTINEEGVLSTNGIRISMPALKNIDGLKGIELYTIASASGDMHNGIRYRYGSNNQIFDIVGTFKSVSADSNGNLVVDGFKAKFSEKSGRIGINNGYITTTNAYVATDKDEIYGTASFFINSDGTIDTGSPVTLNLERTWACFDSRTKCSHNNPEWDLILGDAQGRYDFDDSKISTTKICLQCPKEKLDEFISEIEQGNIQGYAFWEKKQDSNGDFSEALEMRGKLLSTFNNNFIEGNDINIKYSIIDDGKYTDIDFKFLADTGQRQDQKLGRVIAHGKSLELYKDDDGSVHINEHNYAGETVMPLHSNAFIKNAVFNENDISPSTLHSYGSRQIKSIGDDVYSADYNALDLKAIAYLKQKNPDADEKTIREEYLKVVIGMDYAFDSTGKKAKSYEEAYSYGNKIYGLVNKEENEMRAGVPEGGEKAIIRQETFITTPDGINVDAENTYEIGANALITRANPNYEEYLNMKFERDAWQRHSGDGGFQSLGKEGQKKAIAEELTYMRPLILSKAKLNEVRNRIEEIQEKKGTEGGIKEAGMLVYENWLYKDDLAAYWQRLKYLEKEEKGNEEVVQLIRQGKTLSDIRDEHADSENIQLAFRQPELKFLHNQEAIQSAIANGKTDIEIDGAHYDISSEDKVRELVISNYMSTAQAHEGLKNWAEANNYYLAMLKMTMGDDTYKTLEGAIKAQPGSDYFKTYFLSSSEFTEGTLLYAYPDEVKELIRTGNINEKLLQSYVDNKERMDFKSIDIRGVAELILPKDYWQVALNLLPEAKGTVILTKATTKMAPRQATKILMKESAHLAAVATGFGSKGGIDAAQYTLALGNGELMASALGKIQREGTYGILVPTEYIERPRLELPAEALNVCAGCTGAAPTLKDAENLAKRIADGTATEEDVGNYAKRLVSAYNAGFIDDAGIDAQARLIEDAKIRAISAAIEGTGTTKSDTEEIRKAAEDYATGAAGAYEFEKAQQQLMESFVAGDIDQSQFGELKAVLEDAIMRRAELEEARRRIKKV